MINKLKIMGEKDDDEKQEEELRRNMNYAYFREIFVICCFLFKLEHFTGNMYVGKLVDVYYFDKSLPKILL